MIKRNKMEENDQAQTVSAPPSDLIKINILYKKQKVMDALLEYHTYKLAGATPPKSKIQSAIHVLFSDLKPSLERWTVRKSKDNRLSVAEIKKKINSEKFEDIEEAFDEINYWLDEKKITRIDNRKDYDRTDPEMENFYDDE